MFPLQSFVRPRRNVHVVRLL